MNKLRLFALIKFVFSTNNCSESFAFRRKIIL